MMSKKDFIMLADKIRAHHRNFVTINGYDVDMFTQGQLLFLAEFCAMQNPRFMRDRWLDYIAGKCGPNGGEVK